MPSLPAPAAPASPLCGILAALPTPFDGAGALAPAAVAPLLDLAALNGCHGVLMAGSTGEGPSLSPCERVALVAEAAAWRSRRPAGASPFTLLCGTGHPAWPEAARATGAALDAGADAAVVVPPYYFKGVSDDGLVDWFRRVIDGAGSVQPRILFYDIPRHTGVPLPNAVLRRLVDAYGPHGPVVGLKDSTGDRAATLERIALLPELAIFTGTDTHLSAVLAAGGAGAITALAGVRGDLLRRVWDGRAAPDRAAAAGGAAQVELDAGRALLDGWPAVAALKAALAHRIGGDAWRVRPPLCDLPANEGEAFREALARIGAVAQGVD